MKSNLLSERREEKSWEWRYIAMNGIVPLTHEITRFAGVDRCWRSSKARDSESLERDIGAGDPRKSDQTLFPPRQDKVTLNVTLRRVRYLHLWNVGLLVGGGVRSQLCLNVWLYYARPSQWIRRFYSNSSFLLNTIDDVLIWVVRFINFFFFFFLQYNFKTYISIVCQCQLRVILEIDSESVVLIL